MGIGSHQSPVMQKDEWLTPPAIIEALGPFDVDPCSPIKRPWPTAKRHYTIEDNGLEQEWEGRVWLNPPYGRQVEAWLRKLAADLGQLAQLAAALEADGMNADKILEGLRKRKASG